MTRDKPRHSGSAIIIAVAGLSGMAIGWAIGTLSPPTDTVSTVSPAADHELAALVRNLTTELHGLQTNHELMDAHISQELERLRVAIRATPPTRLVGEQAQTKRGCAGHGDARLGDRDAPPPQLAAATAAASTELEPSCADART
jgi:hypothetical protein